MIEKAETPAELRQLLAEQRLADGIVAAFNDKQLQDLLDKGLVTPAMLAVADVATLERPPPLPPLLAKALVDKFNPAAPTASTGDSGDRVAQVEQRMQQLELAANRAMTTTRREADIGKRFRGQVDRVSTLPLLPDMPAPKMKAAVKHLRDMWSLQRPAKRAKRQGAAEQQASSSAAFSAETDSILRHIAQQKNTGTGELREADHMQPAAMELLQGLQQALGSGTGLVLVDTHSSGHLTGPVKKIDCSGLAANNPLWSQLVVPFEFKLHTTDADAAFGQLTETANLVRQQQPERKSLCGVSISLDTVEVFSFDYGPRASFSRIYSSGAQPLKLQSGSAGLRLLASIVAAPLSQLGFEPASLPDGQLADCSFTCTARLALRSESGTQGARQSSRVYLAELDGNRPAVLKLAKTSREAKILTRIWQALQGSNQIVRLLAAGPYHFNGDDWEAVLVEPVVKPLKAGLCVQKMAQVTYDIADAVEQLTKLKIAHCDISPKNIGILDGRGWLFDFGAAKVFNSWDESSSPVSHITGTPMYMAIQVLEGGNHTPNTALESLLYTLLDVCTEGHLSDRDAPFYHKPLAAAMQRLGFMLQPTLGALQHVPDDKCSFLAALHDVFFPMGNKDLRYYERDVLPEHVKAVCRKFIPMK